MKDTWKVGNKLTYGMEKVIKQMSRSSATENQCKPKVRKLMQ